MAHGDPDEKTFLYILYLEHLQLDASAVDYVGSEAAIFWYVGDGEQYHSSQTMVLTKEPVRCTYCSFYSITLPNLPDRSLPVTMTLSVNDEHIGVAFLDFKDFGESHVFKEEKVKLLTDAGVLAVATLHTASQARWSYSAPIQADTTGFFVDPSSDDQAKQLHDYIFPKADDGAEEQDKADAKAEEEAEKARQEEEARKKREADQRLEEQRREDERRLEAQRKREQEEREATRREDERREDERQRALAEDERRRAEERRADPSMPSMSDRHERQRRWEEEEEAERRRRDDFERRKRDYLEKGEPLSSPSGPSDRRKERQQWEEDRERLKRDARRLRERELADLERRAEDRRRQIEALTNSRITSNAVATRETRGEPREASHRTARGGSHSKTLSGPAGRRQERGSYPLAAREDSASEELTFDGEEEEEAPLEAKPSQHGGAASGFQWPRSGGRSGATAATARRQVTPQRHGGHHLVLRGGMQMHGASPPAELSLAERLEHFRSQAALNRLGKNHREVVDSGGSVPMLETIEVSERLGQAEGGTGARSVNTTPRKKFGLRKGDEGNRKANAVLSAVLQDAAGSNFGLSGSVAQMEEAVLRLLVLHKELAGQVEAPQAALADATAGLAPRMLQVLQAAKAVCEANRSKLKAYTEEKQLGIDRSDYLMPQMRAIDRLQQQFSSLMPGQDMPEDKCECGAEFTADAKFCRLCGRRRQSTGTPRASLTAPSSARFSPRDVPRDFTSVSQLQHLQAPSLSSSPPSARRASLSGYARNEVTRPDRPVDPGLPDSQLPALRGGSPPAKPRRSIDGAGVATPRSEVSSIAAPWSGPEYRVRRVNVPAIPHWERQHLAKVGDGASSMWDAVAAAATVKTSPRPAAVADGPVEPIAEVSPLWDAVAGVACGSHLRSPRMPQAVAAPLRTAVQQVRGVANELSRRGRGAGGGAHAGAGSPSPRQEPQGSTESRPPEDKYLKILQSLQAKGAMNGGLAAQLLEKQGLRRRIRGIQDADTDSESSDLR